MSIPFPGSRLYWGKFMKPSTACPHGLPDVPYEEVDGALPESEGHSLETEIAHWSTFVGIANTSIWYNSDMTKWRSLTFVKDTEHHVVLRAGEVDSGSADGNTRLKIAWERTFCWWVNERIKEQGANWYLWSGALVVGFQIGGIFTGKPIWYISNKGLLPPPERYPFDDDKFEDVNALAAAINRKQWDQDPFEDDQPVLRGRYDEVYGGKKFVLDAMEFEDLSAMGFWPQEEPPADFVPPDSGALEEPEANQHNADETDWVHEFTADDF